MAPVILDGGALRRFFGKWPRCPWLTCLSRHLGAEDHRVGYTCCQTAEHDAAYTVGGSSESPSLYGKYY